MKLSRLYLSGSLVIAAVSFSTVGAQILSAPSAHAAGCDTWYGPGGSSAGATSGLWGVASNWSSGATPVPTDNVCITAAGDYTVTLAPWAVGTADPAHNGAVVSSLTLGASSGHQTLIISGQASVSNSNETINNVFINPTGASTINASGKLILDSTNGGTPTPGTDNGASAWIYGGPLINHGQIVAQVEDTASEKGTSMVLQSFTNAPGATLQVSSGQLVQGSGAAFNRGHIIVARRATMMVEPSTYSPAVLTNTSSVVDNGSIIVNGATWNQKAGSIKGNTVTLGNGSTLVDAAGAAKFLENYGTATFKGTIPKGQTVTIMGEPINSGGNQYYNTVASLDATRVVNNGTLILEAPGKGKTSGGNAILENGSLINNGTVIARILDTTWTVNLQVNVTNQRSGSLSITGGQLVQDSGTSSTNNGRINISSGATYVEQGGVLKNSRGAVTSLQIAGAKKLGQIALSAGGVFTAGGKLDLTFVHGYRARARSVFAVVALDGGKFAGAFRALTHNFTLDLKSETANPAFVGVTYRG